MNPKFVSFGKWAQRFLSPVTLVCLLLLGYIVFAGENTVFNSIDYDRTIDSLRQELAANRDTMLYYRGLNRRLASDPDLIEQVEREQYGMKRAGEDVYIFKEKPQEIEE